MNECDLIIIGSGFYSAGLAEGAKNALIVEHGFLVDPVHYATLSGFTPYPCRNFGEKSAKLRAVINSCGALADEKLDVLLLESCLSKYVREREIQILLGASVVSVEEKGKVSVVKMQTNAGIISVSADRVVKCTPQPPDSVRFLMAGNAPKIAPQDTDGFTFTVDSGFADGEFVLTAKSTVITEQALLMPKALRAVSTLTDDSIKIKSVAQRAFSSFDKRFSADPISEFERGIKEGECLLG